MKKKDMENSKKVVLEMEKIEEEFTTAYEAARRCLDSQKEKSSEASEILSIDLVIRMNISSQSERFTEERQNASQESSIDRHPGASLYATSEKVGLVDYSNIRNCTPLKTNETTNYPTIETEQNKLHDGISNKFASDISMQNHQDMTREYNDLSPIVNESRMNAEAVPFELTASNTAPSTGQDLCRQLKRVQIPVFTGDKRQYRS